MVPPLALRRPGSQSITQQHPHNKGSLCKPCASMIKWNQKQDREPCPNAGQDEPKKEELLRDGATVQVRPIQMGELLRKWVSKRLLCLNGVDIGRTMTASR